MAPASLRIAEVGITAMSSTLPRVVMSASAKLSERALCSSTSLRKTKGRTAMEISAGEVGGA
jgi:hypothetical protein